MIKTSSLEKNISNLMNDKNSLETRLTKIMQIARENEIDLEKCRNTLREKEFEIEQVTSFYHTTLEDLAFNCSELESIKDSSIENMQRLKDQISELSLELAIARRRSRGFSQVLLTKPSVSHPVYTINGKNAAGMVESLILDLTRKLKGMSIA